MTPFKGPNRVSSAYGNRTYYNPRRGWVTEFHRGQDIVADDGNWTVRECTGGKCVRVNYDASRGHYVDIQTDANTFERYQHMDKIYVKVGDNVPQGTHVGLAGSSGDVTGRHLHFGVYRGGTAEANAIAPMPWSDVKNGGTTPGNDNCDTNPQPMTPKLVTLKVGPVSPGDRQRVEQLAKEIEVPAVVI